MTAEKVYIGRDSQKRETQDQPTDGFDEPGLIQRLQQGDIAALGKLFEAHKALVYRTSLAIARDERIAEDVLQECFVRLYRYADSVDPDRPLKPWLYRVTVNLSYDLLTTRAARPLEDVSDWLLEIASALPTPDRRVEEQETTRMVREVVAELPPLHRAVIVLHYMENLAVEEIAQVLELPPGTVKSRLYYARERLREMLTRRQRLVPEMNYEFT
ncbi:MAG: RNA polymerase sigma factor [Anaerolineae bacterium]